MPPAVGGLLIAGAATFGSAMLTGAVSVGTAAILAGIDYGGQLLDPEKHGR